MNNMGQGAGCITPPGTVGKYPLSNFSVTKLKPLANDVCTKVSREIFREKKLATSVLCDLARS